MKKAAILLVFLLFITHLKATTIFVPEIEDSLLITDSLPLKNIMVIKDLETSEDLKWQIFEISEKSSDAELIATKKVKEDEGTQKIMRRKKIIASVLAFPVPGGIFGAHRIYLGTKPYIPLVYIATLGGAAGIVPFIDFVVLCLEKDVSKYCNNPHVIMWAK